MNYFFKRIFVNFKNAILYEGTVLEKLYVLWISYKLLIKRSLFQTTTLVHSSLFGFKAFASSYGLIEYLFTEIFVLKDYFFSPSGNKPVILDCGANIGMSVFYFKHVYPESKIYSFEANPETFKMLQKNISENKLADVTAYNVALYDESGEIYFYHDEEAGTLHGSLLETRGGQAKIMVKTMMLSDFIRKMDHVDLIKIDVEGAEINVVNDLFNNSLLHKADQYIVEYHHNLETNSAGFSDFLKKFETAGFRYNLKTSYKDIRSFQDILIHFYKP